MLRDDADADDVEPHGTFEVFVFREVAQRDLLEPPLVAARRVLCGQVAGLVKKEQPAAEILREVCEEAELLLKGASRWVKQ